MRDHETVSIPLKMIDVDKGIVPIVNWLNSKLEVFTLYSCQGGPPTASEIYDETVSNPAYVMFFCRDKDSLETIESAIAKFCEHFMGNGYVWMTTSHERSDNILLTNFNLCIDYDILPGFIAFIEKLKD